MEQQFYDSAPEEDADADLYTAEREPLPKAMWVALVIVGVAVISGAGLLVWRNYWQIQPVPLVGEEATEHAPAKATKETKLASREGTSTHEEHPATAAPEPATAEPASAGPETAEPASAGPETAEPATAAPVATAAPATAAPATTAPASAAPAGDGAERLAKLLKQGDALNRGGAGGGALRKFQEALTIDAGNAHAHAGMAMAYLSMSRNADALASAQRAVAIDDSEVQANFVIGYVQRRADPATARAALERCVAAGDRTWSGECRGVLAGIR
jgi:cytoskeletal protein RodZ